MENQSCQIRNGFTLELVHTDKQGIRIFLGGLDRRVAQGKTDSNDDVVFSIDELGKVVCIVLGILGFDVLDMPVIQTELFFCLLYAFPCRLVKTAVVDTADISDQSNLEGGSRERCECQQTKCTD